MRLQKAWYLRAPNIWADEPVLEAWLVLEPEPTRSLEAVTRFSDRLAACLATLSDLKCGPAPSPELLARPRQNMEPAEAVGLLTRQFQSLDGEEHGAGWFRPAREPGLVRLAVPVRSVPFGRACLASAVALCQALVHDQPFDLAGEVARLRELEDLVWPGLVTKAVEAAARERGIPAVRPFRYRKETVASAAVQPDLIPAEPPVYLLESYLFVLGQGARQRRYFNANTNRTPLLADSLTTNKHLTKMLLREAGLPVASGRPVQDAEDAWAAACEIGVPVVVKPQDSDYGHGVGLHLTTRAEILAAYAAAKLWSDRILVERHAQGREYRLLVVGDRMVAAILREPPTVVGDGVSTVAQLVEQANRDPHRGEAALAPLRQIKLDETAVEVIAAQGFALDSVPPAGIRVLIRRNTHRGDGGINTDVTDLVHPTVAERACEAASIVGLDVAGIDLMAHDIGRPLEDQGGVILEVNAGPALNLHLNPASGQPRPVVRAIIDLMFPEGDSGRIPVVAVAGTRDTTDLATSVARLLRARFGTVGLACAEGTFLNDRRIELDDRRGPEDAWRLLLHPLVETAVLETSAEGILTGGLGFDRCDVAVVTSIGTPAVAQPGLETEEDLAELFATMTRRALFPTGAAVLNAGDSRVAELAQTCPAPVIFFDRDGDHPVLVGHRATGGKTVFLSEGAVVLAEGNREPVSIDLGKAPVVESNLDRGSVQCLLAAVAVAWVLGLHPFGGVDRVIPEAALAT